MDGRKYTGVFGFGVRWLDVDIGCSHNLDLHIDVDIPTSNHDVHEFIELYFKGDKENENHERIKKYLKDYQKEIRIF